MIDFLLIFLLAHLIGDFVLQTNKIAHLKAQGVRGLLIHCAVVFIVQVAFMSLFGLKGFVAAVIVSIIHFLIDYFKNKLNKFFKRCQSLFFLIDQAVHVAVIWIFSDIFFDKHSFDASLIVYTKYGISLILSTYVSSVFVKILLKDLFAAQKSEPFFKELERCFDMFAGILAFFAFTYQYIVSLPVVIILGFVYCLLQKKIWSYALKESILKFIFIAVFSLLSSLLITI